MKYLLNDIFIKGKEPATAAALIKAVIETPKAGGLNVSEMRKGLKILDAIEEKKEGDEIAFEDVDAMYLQKEVEGFKWAMLHVGVVAFCDAVKNMGSKSSKK